MLIHIKELSKNIDSSTICNLNPLQYKSHSDLAFQPRNTFTRSNSAYHIKVFFIKTQNSCLVFMKKYISEAQ